MVRAVPLCPSLCPSGLCPRLRGLRSAQHPSESLPASYGPGAGMRVRVFAYAPFVPLCGLAGFTPPSTPLRVSRQATAPEQGCGCACLPVPPLCPSVGSVLILASSALLSAPLRASRSATAPEQGRGHECLAGVSVYPPRGVIFGEALYPIPFTLHMHRRLIRGLTSPST